MLSPAGEKAYLPANDRAESHQAIGLADAFNMACSVSA
jgi:hypothetical protein